MSGAVNNMSHAAPDQRQKEIRGLYVARGSQESTIRVLPTVALGPRKRVDSHHFSAGL